MYLISSVVTFRLFIAFLLARYFLFPRSECSTVVLYIGSCKCLHVPVNPDHPASHTPREENTETFWFLSVWLVWCLLERNFLHIGVLPMETFDFLDLKETMASLMCLYMDTSQVFGVHTPWLWLLYYTPQARGVLQVKRKAGSPRQARISQRRGGATRWRRESFERLAFTQEKRWEFSGLLPSTWEKS